MTQWLQKMILPSDEMPSNEIIFDEKVLQSILNVINDAEKSLILVSPYNKYPLHLRDALNRAANRKVQIIAVCREGQGKDERSHWEWLAGIGAEVHVVERLHAKIYCNESTAIMTSMNLHESSAINSKEIGFIIRSDEQRHQISEYVTTRLIQHSKPFNSSPKQASLQQAQRPTSTPAPKAKPPKTPARGLCIRGGEEIPYNPERPLCLKCFRSWNNHQDPDYVEKYCHHCGKKRKTSFAKPLCKDHSPA